MREPFESMERWYRKNRRFAVAQVVGEAGSGPREAGALMAVNEFGDVAGSVSGGCVEGSVREAALEVIESGQERTLSFSADEDQASPETWGLPAPCGARVDVRVRPFTDEALALMRNARDQRRPRVVCVGAVHVSEALVRLAREVGYATVVVDPRRAFARAERMRAADKVVEAWPQEALPALGLTKDDAVLALTHDAKIDVAALACALATPCGYVGCLGHAETLADRRQALLDAGVAEGELARVFAPVGMFLGGREPEDIALSALAQIQAARHGRLARVAELPGCTLDAFTPARVADIARRREEARARGERLDSYLPKGGEHPCA